MTSMKVARIERAKARGQYTKPGTKANRNPDVICQNCTSQVNAPSQCYNGEAEDEGFVGRKHACEHFIRNR